MKEQSIRTKVGNHLSQKLKSVTVLLRTWDLRLRIWLVSKKLQKQLLKRWKQPRVHSKSEMEMEEHDLLKSVREMDAIIREERK